MDNLKYNQSFNFLCVSDINSNFTKGKTYAPFSKSTGIGEYKNIIREVKIYDNDGDLYPININKLPIYFELIVN